MKTRMMICFLMMGLGMSGAVLAADNNSSLGTQAGEAARELQGTADATLSTGAAKLSEATTKVQTEVQSTMKTLQQQWDDLSKQFQAKTEQLRKQLDQQWQDFNKSFNKPKQ